MLKRTDIKQRLSALQETHFQEVALQELLQAHAINEASLTEKESAAVQAPEKSVPVNSFDFDRLDTSRIYHMRHIRQICIDYRLRFLDLKYFKPELPEEAHQAIAEIEAVHGTRLEKFKIIAPSKLFKLADKDDPLLFVPMGNDYFYLVHKWGNDLHPLRKLLVWPFKNIINLSLLVLFVSLLATFLVPAGLFSKNNSSTEFWIIFFFMFKSIAAVVIYYGFALGKNFNPAIWNSKYFNA
jgi:hypothetical protein